MLIEIRNLYTDEVIFSLDVENNSIRRTVEEAVKQGADLRCANLSGVDFSGAYLKYVDFSGANLCNANLSGANLKCANLSGVDFSGACLGSTKNVPDLPMVCPKEGSFIAWKKIWKYKEGYVGLFIVKLEIPEDAKRSSATTHKCRCSKAKVLEIRSIDTNECVDIITNTNKHTCIYKVDEYVYSDDFDENRWEECSNGIHFFMTEREAFDLAYRRLLQVRKTQRRIV